MQTSYGDNLIVRNGWYSFLYTVPLEYRSRRGGSRQIVKSLKTRDLTKAKRLVQILKTKYILQYESHDFSEIKDVAYEVAVSTANRFGFDYSTTSKLQTAGPQDFVELSSPRVEAREGIRQPNLAEIKTIGGAVDLPTFPVSKLFARWKELKPEMVALMNVVDAQEKWRRYERSAELFIRLMGDRDVLKMKDTIADEYRDALVKCVLSGDFLSEYANRAMRYMRSMLKVVLKRDHPGIANPFREFETIQIADAGKREALTEDEVRTIREKSKTSDISDEAKAMLMVSQNLGVGIRELCFLAPDDVVLTGDIPHLKIRKNKFRNYLKTKERERELPLIGEALEAMKRFPNGFPAFTDPLGPRRMYTSIHRFMKIAAPNKTFTGYRHRIAELLRNSEFKDQFQNAVMGHATPGQTGYYGGPVWLKNMHKMLMETLPEDNR